MDKFCDALDNFFCFVRRHYGAFYWISWAYIITLCVLQTVFDFADTITAVAIIPINLLTWPVFLETRKLKDLPFLVERSIWGLLVMSTLLPLCILLIFYDGKSWGDMSRFWMNLHASGAYHENRHSNRLPGIDVGFQTAKRTARCSIGSSGRYTFLYAQTSWTMAISAASPRRGPILTTRV